MWPLSISELSSDFGIDSYYSTISVFHAMKQRIGDKPYIIEQDLPPWIWGYKGSKPFRGRTSDILFPVVDNGLYSCR